MAWGAAAAVQRADSAPRPLPVRAQARPGPWGPGRRAETGLRAAARLTFPRKAAPEPLVSTRSDQAVPAAFAFSAGFLLSLREGSRCSPPSRFCSFRRAFRRVPASLWHPSPPPTQKSVPQGHFLKNGRNEKLDILENLVNSRLVSPHFLKNHNL